MRLPLADTESTSIFVISQNLISWMIPNLISFLQHCCFQHFHSPVKEGFVLGGFLIAVDQTSHIYVNAETLYFGTIFDFAF